MISIMAMRVANCSRSVMRTAMKPPAVVYTNVITPSTRIAHVTDRCPVSGSAKNEPSGRGIRTTAITATAYRATAVWNPLPIIPVIVKKLIIGLP